MIGCATHVFCVLPFVIFFVRFGCISERWRLWPNALRFASIHVQVFSTMIKDGKKRTFCWWRSADIVKDIRHTNDVRHSFFFFFSFWNAHVIDTLQAVACTLHFLELKISVVYWMTSRTSIWKRSMRHNVQSNRYHRKYKWRKQSWKLWTDV